jgi:glutathione S-transferase
MAKIIIYSWPGVEGLASMSPFSLKPIIAAKAKGLPFDVEYVRRVPTWVTTGKLPAAMIDNNPVLDSTNIMKAIDILPSEKPALYPTDPALKADVVLLEDWADESLFWYMVGLRFNNQNNFMAFSQEAFGKLKWPWRGLIPKIMRKTALSRLKAQGLGCLSERDRDMNFKDLCHALDQRLSGRSYFVGSHLTAADIAVYAQLKQITHGKFTPGYSIITECNNLMAFMERMDQI